MSGLKGLKLLRVRRQLLSSDYIELPRAIRDEESDGPIELSFDSGTVIHIDPDTEKMGILVSPGEMPQWGESYRLVDPSRNDFWSKRVGKRVAHLDLLTSNYASEECPSEFALQFTMDDGTGFVAEYLSDEDHTDTLRVTESCEGPFTRHSIC